MKLRIAPDWDALAAQVAALVAAPDPSPRYLALWISVAPIIEAWVERPGFLGRVADDEDLRREIVVRAWIKLRDREHACLRAFVARAPAGGPQLRGYLYRVVKNVGIDYLRSLPELVRGPGAAAQWRELVSWGDAHDVANDNAPPVTARWLLAALDEHAASEPRHVERRCYRGALELWSQGYDSDEIAAALALPDAASAERVVAAAKELLRRRFRAA